MPNSPKLPDRVRDKLGVNHYSLRAEQTYLDWIRRYNLFHNKRHLKDTQRMRAKFYRVEKTRSVVSIIRTVDTHLRCFIRPTVSLVPRVQANENFPDAIIRASFKARSHVYRIKF